MFDHHVLLLLQQKVASLQKYSSVTLSNGYKTKYFQNEIGN